MSERCPLYPPKADICRLRLPSTIGLSAPCASEKEREAIVSNIVYLSAMLPRAHQRLIHSQSRLDRR
jgi:hypothetical protein